MYLNTADTAIVCCFSQHRSCRSNPGKSEEQNEWNRVLSGIVLLDRKAAGEKINGYRWWQTQRMSWNTSS